jgi:hypothetical protein
LITVSTEDAELTGTLTETETLVDDILSPTRIIQGLPSGSSIRDTTIIVTIAIIAELVRHPEKARRHVVMVDLPASFGERPQVGKLSIQAFTNDPDNSQPAYFRLYGLGMGNRAIGSSASIDRREERIVSNHSHAAGLAGLEGGGGSTAIDQIILTPKNLSLARRDKVKYQIHSRAAFNSVKAVFYRVEEYGRNVSSTEVVHTEDLGPITENGWLQPQRCRCEWDGKQGGAPSRGLHDLEIRAWHGREIGDWASAWSDPKRIRIN